MAWTYRLTATAEKTLRKLDPPQQRRIFRFLEERIQGAQDPRAEGKALKGQH
ncbi:type II toxin-antitoxin system RelE family toxin [Thiohalorhabdus sp.]|uniref:type II toxin-antitoxin system RelE family toxin n=1 Tax=Thiohalorhabdus sp. TaxID=3094134 RepID=UPI002FC28620